MRTPTPIATPVVPAPRAVPAAAKSQRSRPELVPPVSVISPLGELELSSGSLLLGRLPECDICLTDQLVSRMHGRISVQADRVVIEDLHSTNGVYVNGLRVGHDAILREGDRILIGTTELSLFECRDSSLMRIRAAVPVQPEPAYAPLHQQPPHQAPLPPPRKPQQIPSTARADALKMIGGLADRLASSGNVEEATQVLSGHLKRILKGANAGLAVLPEVAGTASHHALTLARWTKLPLWADYVVELHLSARLMMSAPTLATFEDVAAKVDFDKMLLNYYVEGLAKNAEALAPEERKRLTVLSRLASGS